MIYNRMKKLQHRNLKLKQITSGLNFSNLSVYVTRILNADKQGPSKCVLGYSL